MYGDAWDIRDPGPEVSPLVSCGCLVLMVFGCVAAWVLVWKVACHMWGLL